MAKAHIRVKELSAGELIYADTHNGRHYIKKELPVPDGINVSQSDMNIGHVFNNDPDEEISIEESVKRRIKKSGVKVKKNSVMALEYVLSTSPDFYQVYSPSGHFSNSIKWIAKKHGQENLISYHEHYDEINPHVHVIVVPIIKKQVRWKCKKGNEYLEGSKIEDRLCARDFTGNPKLLRKLQDDYYEFCRPYGEKYGITFERGIKVEEQTTKYARKTNHEMGLLNIQMENCKHSSQEVDEQLNRSSISFKEAQEKHKSIEAEARRLKAILEQKEREKDAFLQKQAEKEQENRRLEKWREQNKNKDFGMGM